jgi:hypothetical protein
MKLPLIEINAFIANTLVIPSARICPNFITSLQILFNTTFLPQVYTNRNNFIDVFSFAQTV